MPERESSVERAWSTGSVHCQAERLLPRPKPLTVMSISAGLAAVSACRSIERVCGRIGADVLDDHVGPREPFAEQRTSRRDRFDPLAQIGGPVGEVFPFLTGRFRHPATAIDFEADDLGSQFAQPAGDPGKRSCHQIDHRDAGQRPADRDVLCGLGLPSPGLSLQECR